MAAKKQRVIWHLPYAVIGGVETLYATILKYVDRGQYEHIVTCPNTISAWVSKKYRNLAKVRTFELPEDLAITLDS